MGRNFNQLSLEERRKIERWRLRMQICDCLNATPRKCLDWKTLAEPFKEKVLVS